MVTKAHGIHHEPTTSNPIWSTNISNVQIADKDFTTQINAQCDVPHMLSQRTLNQDNLSMAKKAIAQSCHHICQAESNSRLHPKPSEWLQFIIVVAA